MTTTLSEKSDSVNDMPSHLASCSGDDLMLASSSSDDQNELRELDPQSGKVGWAILWLLGIPLPVLLIAYLIWGR